MIINMSYWTRVIKNILYVLLLLIGMYIALKLSIFYMPFLVAFIIALMIEPAIKYIMKKTNFTRSLLELNVSRNQTVQQLNVFGMLLSLNCEIYVNFSK